MKEKIITVNVRQPVPRLRTTTATREQQRRRAFWFCARYAAIIIASVIAFSVAVDAKRQIFGVDVPGGEALILLAPVVIFIGEIVIRDVIKDTKRARHGKF